MRVRYCHRLVLGLGWARPSPWGYVAEVLAAPNPLVWGLLPLPVARPGCSATARLRREHSSAYPAERVVGNMGSPTETPGHGVFLQWSRSKLVFSLESLLDLE